MWFLKGVMIGLATGVFIGSEKGDEISYFTNRCRRKMMKMGRRYGF